MFDVRTYESQAGVHLRIVNYGLRLSDLSRFNCEVRISNRSFLECEVRVLLTDPGSFMARRRLKFPGASKERTPCEYIIQVFRYVFQVHLQAKSSPRSHQQVIILVEVHSALTFCPCVLNTCSIQILQIHAVRSVSLVLAGDICGQRAADCSQWPFWTDPRHTRRCCCCCFRDLPQGSSLYFRHRRCD